MFERKVEAHQEESFAGLDNARQYAESAKKSMLRYRAFLKNLESLDILPDLLCLLGRTQISRPSWLRSALICIPTYRFTGFPVYKFRSNLQ